MPRRHTTQDASRYASATFRSSPYLPFVILLLFGIATMTVLTLKAKNDYLQKVAGTRDFVRAISEFVWNSLDADATEVSVDLVRNALGGLNSIIIRDNGTGITSER